MVNRRRAGWALSLASAFAAWACASQEGASVGDGSLTTDASVSDSNAAQTDATDNLDGSLTTYDGSKPLRPTIVTGPGPNPTNSTHVRVLDAAGKSSAELRDVFGADLYGANVAACDVNGDGISEIIVGEGPGPANGTTVRILSAGGALVKEIPSTFAGATYGVNVACGDIDGDKVPEIIVGLGAGASNDSRVRAFDVNTLLMKADFVAFDPGVHYGTRVAAGDVDGDGKAEIAVTPGPSSISGAHLKVFSANGTLRGDVHPFSDSAVYGDVNAPFGATVAMGDLDGDGIAEIATALGPAPLASPHVKIYSSKMPGALQPVSEFQAVNPIPHLRYNGYFHVHDASFGLHIPDVKDFTNWAYLWDTKYLADAKGAGLKVVFDLQKSIREAPKANWDANLKALAPIFASYKDTIVALYLYDEPDIGGLPSLADQKALVDLVKANIPGFPTTMSLVTQTTVPEGLDWVAIDPYMNIATAEVGCVGQDRFNGVLSRIAWAASTGKPVLLIPSSFGRTSPSPIAMPTTCQQRWYMEASVNTPEVIANLWFMYGHAKESERGEEIQGVGETPAVLAFHKEMFRAAQYGGYGAELAIGDVDGDGVGEIVVGQGKGRGNTTMVKVYSSSGTEKYAFRGYETANYGVSVAVGVFDSSK